MSNERVLPNQFGVMARLRATSGIEMDIGATKDPCGILEGKNGNLPKIMKGLQTGFLALEKDYSLSQKKQSYFESCEI